MPGLDFSIEDEQINEYTQNLSYLAKKSYDDLSGRQSDAYGKLYCLIWYEEPESFEEVENLLREFPDHQITNGSITLYESKKAFVEDVFDKAYDLLESNHTNQ